MSDKDTKKYYWLKLDKDFFKKHDIRIIEGMPNGKDYILFYLKLLCESTTHEGYLRFSDTIPYSLEMLSTITNTNIDIVRSAVTIFTQLNMMQILDDGTIFMDQVSKMIGSETGAAIRKREYRNGTTVGQCPLEIEKDIDIEKERKENNNNNIVIKEKKSVFSKPSLEEIKNYVLENNKNVDYEKFYNYYETNGWKVGKNPMKNWKAAIALWERNNRENNVVVSNENNSNQEAKKESGDLEWDFPI